MSLDVLRLKQRARRAYELGRLQNATWAALLVCVPLALASAWLIGAGALRFVPLTFLLWVALGWRGGVVLRGARYGLLAGAVTLLVPLSVLRPCCRWDESGVASCTMPEMCVAMGALLGLPLAAFVLTRAEPRRLQLALGAGLGAVSVAVFKCSALFAGEALGLLAGLALSLLAASVWSHARVQRA